MIKDDTMTDDEGEVVFIYQPNPDADSPANIALSADATFNLYTIVHNIGYDRAMEVTEFSLWLIKQIIRAGVPDIEDAFRGFWPMLAGYTETGQTTINSDEELVLSFTYGRLVSKGLTRDQAAEFATNHLSPNDPISTDAWRMKVDRWAKRQGLPPVGIRKRQPKASNGTNAS